MEEDTLKEDKNREEEEKQGFSEPPSVLQTALLLTKLFFLFIQLSSISVNLFFSSSPFHFS